MNRAQPSELSPQILDAASRWFVEFSEGQGDLAQREQFVKWLRVSPEHVRAYLQIAAHWEDARILAASSHTATVDELVTLGRQESLAIPLDRESYSVFASEPTTGITEAVIPVAAGHRRSGVWGLRRPRALGFVTLAVVAAVSLWLYGQRGIYSTDVGEQRFIKLADGSTVDLNARSRIRVRFDNEQREVELLEGQALFSVAKDALRPFVVQANQTRVIALGTQFDVYRKSTGTVVTVVEGKVAVRSEQNPISANPVTALVGESSLQSDRPSPTAAASAAPAGVTLTAGEQVVVGSTTMRRLARADVAAATAWTQKQLIFRSSSLSDVVEEFNRYNERKMIILDPQLGGLRISGVFSSTEPTSLLRALEAQGTFTIRETADAIEIAQH